jgi:hypothetical protein
MEDVNLLRATVVFLIAMLLTSSAASQSSTPEDELPEGEGKKILETRCNACHELTEVTKFRGYYDREQWRDIIATMVEYGAELQNAEADTLADYLAKHLGK